MRRLAWLAALAAAAPDTDTQLKRAAALARWVDRTGPAPPSWTVAPKLGPEARRERVAEVPECATYNVPDGRRLSSDEKQPLLPQTGRLRARGPRRARGAREVCQGDVCFTFRKDTCVGRRS